MGLIDDMKKAVEEAEEVVKEAQAGIRILKAAEEDVTELEERLEISVDKVTKMKAAILKELKTKA